MSRIQVSRTMFSVDINFLKCQMGCYCPTKHSQVVYSVHGRQYERFWVDELHTFSIINSFFSPVFLWFSMDENGSIICRNQIMNKSQVFQKCENIRTQNLRWNDEDDRHWCDGCGQSQTNCAVAALNGIQNPHKTTTHRSERKKSRSHTLSPICLFFISHSYISIVLIYDARFACAHPMANAKWNRWRSVAHGVRILWCRTQRQTDKSGTTNGPSISWCVPDMHRLNIITICNGKW